jgi:hypothetical protein
MLNNEICDQLNTERTHACTFAVSWQLLIKQSVDQIGNKSVRNCLCVQTNTQLLLTDEIVILARLELQSSRLRCERPKCYGEVHQLVWFITDCYNPRILICDPTSVIFFLWYLEQFKNASADSRCIATNKSPRWYLLLTPRICVTSGREFANIWLHSKCGSDPQRLNKW